MHCIRCMAAHTEVMRLLEHTHSPGLGKRDGVADVGRWQGKTMGTGQQGAVGNDIKDSVAETHMCMADRALEQKRGIHGF